MHMMTVRELKELLRNAPDEAFVLMSKEGNPDLDFQGENFFFATGVCFILDAEIQKVPK